MASDDKSSDILAIENALVLSGTNMLPAAHVEALSEVIKVSPSNLGLPPSHRETRADDSDRVVAYRLYKRRFVGLVALILLNILGGLAAPWFGPIANDVSADFGFSLDQINWLNNVVSLVYIPSSLVVPILCQRWGIRLTCYGGALLLVISTWVRFAGTARSLSKNGSLCLIIFGQILAGAPQPVFQVLGPLYSETWFSLKGRTTATMLVSIANPLGTAIAQIISPVVGTPRTSILVLAIVQTIIAPCALLITDAPPIPPTYAASQKSPSLKSLLRAMTGYEPKSNHTYMSQTERLDFLIITINFGVLIGVVTAFAAFTAQDLGPYGYSSDTAGFMGATLLLIGLAAAVVTAPIFDRVLTRHLALTCRTLCPILGVLWLSLIWAVKPRNTGALYVILGLIGACSMPVLPVALELAVEITRNADGSSAILWAAGNLGSIILVLAEGALRAGLDADPPLNMHRALIFQGAFVLATVVTIAGLRGKQIRRERDERELAESKYMMATAAAADAAPV